uniref:Uncharacterized protein n=1 Tax=mine drainage metagenome TaxID=410659 RepID=E6QE29_9ZZZZ
MTVSVDKTFNIFDRTHKNFINMAYLILGKLDLRLPT